MPAWKAAGAPYLPLLAAAEDRYGIPTDLLARMAYQESRFRADIIDCTTKSSAGCVGLMQLQPLFFPGAGQSWETDIQTAAKFLAGLHVRFADWQVSVAAYNWGGGNVHHEYAANAHKFDLSQMPPQTQDYVREVFADVPVHGVLLT